MYIYRYSTPNLVVESIAYLVLYKEGNTSLFQVQLYKEKGKLKKNLDTS
jgi:hypothetical protein